VIAMQISIDTIRQDLKQLKLGAMAENLQSVIADAARNNRDNLTVIKLLVDMEREERWKNSISRRFSQTKLPEKVTIDQFDFHHHPSRLEQKTKIPAFLNLDFIDKTQDLIFIGNPGTGKTMLAKCIAMAACNANRKVLFTTAIDMINHLVVADADRSLLKKLIFYQTPDLLVCDELGYLPLGQQG
jgi:DNA replication protein DnaC